MLHISIGLDLYESSKCTALFIVFCGRRYIGVLGGGCTVERLYEWFGW